jgi:4-azaleucine resistance transporter AzlC
MPNKENKQKRFVSQGLQDGFPIFLGYLPPSMAFGMMAQQFHWAPWQILLTSAILYAGTSQFVLLSLTAAHSPGWSSVITIWLVNLRHVAYGPALTLAHSQKRRSLLEILSIGWGLTDEVFATVCQPVEHKSRDERIYLLAVAILAYGGWIGGTALGIGVGQSMLHEIPHASYALGFSLPALFLYILVSAVMHQKRWQWQRIKLLFAASILYLILKAAGVGMISILLSALIVSIQGVVSFSRITAGKRGEGVEL